MNDTITNLIADIRIWEKNAKANCAEPRLAEVGSALVSVLDPIATRLEQLIKDGVYKGEAELAKKRELIGNCANNRHIASWNYSDELDIVCRATGNAKGIEWDFSLEELGRIRAQGTVYGGRWLAIRLAKAMRNGMTSYRKKYRKSRSNRAARKSAELAAAAKEESKMNAETTKKLHALVRLCNEIIAEPDTAAKNAQIIKAELLALCKSESRTGDPVDTCLRLASRASCSAVRIYNLIRAVGRGELSADNALHQLVEDYHDLGILSNDISHLADGLEKEEK